MVRSEVEVTTAKIPVRYELAQFEEADDRFQKVKIWICHTGENLNYTYFTKEVLEQMSASLSYIPIVGFIQETEENKDFKGHEFKIEVDKDGAKMVYKGNAYGFLPENPNAQFEVRDGKEWLTAEGYLWTKFTNALDLFKDSGNSKSQSMEIQDVEGYKDKFGRTIFTAGKFNSLCILGDDVPPAMAGSTIEFYSAVKADIQQMITEFTKKEGEKQVPKKEEAKAKDEELEEGKEAEKVEEPKDAEGEKAPKEEEKEPEKSEDDEKKKADFEKKDEDPEPSEGDGGGEEKDPEPEPEEDEKDKKKANFQLEFDAIREKVQRAFSIKIADADAWVYPSAIYNDHAIVSVERYGEDGYKTSFMRASYTTENDEIQLGELSEVFLTYLTKEQVAEVEAKEQEKAQLTQRLEELEAFKAKADEDEKKAVIEKFGQELTEEEKAEFTQKLAEFSAVDLEKELAFICYSRVQAAKEPGEEHLTVLPTQKEESKYGALDRYFK